MKDITERVLSEEDRNADREIAIVLNKIEDLQLKKTNEKEFNSLILRLKYFSEQFPKRVKTHIDEIKDYVEGVIEFYESHNKSVPDTNFLYK